MKWRCLLLTIVTVVVLAIFAFGILFVYAAFKFESRVNSRLETFAEMPYAAWEALHASCAALAVTEEALSFSYGTADYETLPTPIKALEPMLVWVKPDQVTLKFSGGHSRFVVIEFYGDRTPSELELIAEGFFDGVVCPRSDQRLIGHLDEARPIGR
ncbi:MAG: hypothetical protein ACSHYA_04330 [Opitutaceae bacterium]